LVDTFYKSGGGLLDRWALADLASYVDLARQSRVKIVLAGSLNLDTVVQVLPLGPDYVAVRGAVCGFHRTGAIVADRIRAIQDVMLRANAQRVPAIA
jgi:uncharacterized protein (UPF0264 family)